MHFDTGILDNKHFVRANDILAPVGKSLTRPDRIIAPDGKPYLYRYHIVKTSMACVYLHIQVRSDPERPLHDHPFDNQSVILGGGYDEVYRTSPIPYMWPENHENRRVRSGDVVHRKAEEAHRLVLPKDIPYSLSVFSTGRHRRAWGFWYPDGWRDFRTVTREEGNISFHIKPESM